VYDRGEPVLEVDKIINIPKIKTHMMTVYSGAVKNLFGIIPGSYKAEYHLRFEDTMVFADLLIDICSFAKPVLTVMDAVIGMEGYGPTAGSPKKVGLVIAGTNPFALDVVASDIIGLRPEQIPTVVKSVERGFCSGNVKEISVVGEKLQDVYVKNFKKPTVKVAFNYYNIFLPKFLVRRLNKIIKPRPSFKYEACKSCGMCASCCPPKAITMKDGKPVVDLNKCIRCFCCHELCNFEAVDIKRPWFIKLVLR
jgi:Fe-S-cluster-containing hydrogenase component 2